MTERKPLHLFSARLLLGLFAVLGALVLTLPDADAARLGGGRSFGRQSQNATRQAPPPTQEATRPAPQAQPAQPPMQQPPMQPARNRWLGPLAGIAAGVGIAALLSHFGLMGPVAEMMGSFLLIALLVIGVMIAWRLLRGARPASVQREAMAYHGAGTNAPAQTYDGIAAGARAGSVASLSGAGAAQPVAAQPVGVPADFDTAGFVRNAKVHFLRLQAAWDARDLADIREFTTPEVFAEIRMQIEEREGQSDQTEVNDLEAQLLGIEDSPEGYLASVRFTGRVRESANGPVEPLEEVWNLWKPREGRTGWLLAGIQQVH